MYDKIRDFASLMGKAGEFKRRLEQMQQDLAGITVEADAGAGAVRVTANGQMQVVSVRLDRPLIQSIAGRGDDADTRVIEDLVTAAVNAALEKAKQAAQQELAKAGGDLNVPGMPDLQGLLGGAGGATGT